MPVDQQQIRPAIIVDIHKHASPAEVLGVDSQSGIKRHVGEGVVSVMVVKRGSVVRKVGFDYVQVAVSVVVSDGRSHARLFASIIVEGHAAIGRGIGECAIVIVAIEDGGGGIAGNENVGPSILVVVDGSHAEAIVTHGLFKAAHLAHIGKFSVTQIVIEQVR